MKILALAFVYPLASQGADCLEINQRVASTAASINTINQEKEMIVFNLESTKTQIKSKSDFIKAFDSGWKLRLDAATSAVTKTQKDLDTATKDLAKLNDAFNLATPIFNSLVSTNSPTLNVARPKYEELVRKKDAAAQKVASLTNTLYDKKMDLDQLKGNKEAEMPGYRQEKLVLDSAQKLKPDLEKQLSANGTKLKAAQTANAAALKDKDKYKCN